MKVFNNYIYPVATMAGSIIGVGIFSLPYIASKSGIWLTLGYFLVLTAVVILIHLVFVEISLKTPDFKRFPGFAGHHLGKFAKAIALFAIIFGSFGVLLAYLIIGSEFLASALVPYFGGSALFYTILYFLAVSITIGLGIKIVAKAELWALILFLFVLSVILAISFPQMKLGNIFVSNFDIRISDFFLPYGAIMFALWGTGMIPEVEEMLPDKKNIKKIIIISTLIPAAVYVFFIFLILGITGASTTESALTGLKNFLGKGMFSFALFAGVITTFTAFIANGLTLKKVLAYDMGIKNSHAFIITCFIPLILFLLGMKSFISLLSFTGGVLLGINGILILFMYKKIGGKNIIIFPLLFIFLLGLIYEITWFFKF